MQPLDRNQFVARKLGKLNNQIILDIGCRDQVFKKSLHGDFKYIGFFQKLKTSKFGKMDSKLFSPLCLTIGLIGIIIELNKW